MADRGARLLGTATPDMEGGTITAQRGKPPRGSGDGAMVGRASRAVSFLPDRHFGEAVIRRKPVSGEDDRAGVSHGPDADAFDDVAAGEI